MVKFQRLLLGFFVFCLSFAAVAEIRFQSLDINDQSQLLFRAQVEAPRYGSYSTGFSTDISSGVLNQLSFFPEQFVWLSASNELQVQNRFGVFRSQRGLSALQAVKGFSNFMAGGEITNGKLNPVGASPDGKYLVYVKPTSPAYGDLVVLDVASGKESIASSQVEIHLDDVPVRWAPDSQMFIYAKDNQLYYYALAQQTSKHVLGENLRSMGPGHISSIQWGTANQLYLVSGSLVYEIVSAEIFTRSLYQDFLKIGRIVGRLPNLYDPNFDRFWVSPNGNKILLDKGGSGIFLYLLKTGDYAEDGKAVELPYLVLPRNGSLYEVLWSSSERITLLTHISSPTGTEEKSVIYRLDASLPLSSYRFTVLESVAVRDMVLSPDEQYVALLNAGTVQIREYDSWKPLIDISHPDPLHLVFTDNDTMIVAGRYFTERVLLDKKTDLPAASGNVTNRSTMIATRSFLFFSQIEEMGFDKETGLASARSGTTAMLLDKSGWIPRIPFAIRDAASASSQFRVYLENLYSGPYANLVMVRKAQEVGTFQLFNPPKTGYEDFPVSSNTPEKIDFSYFEHGKRQGIRQVSLTFNGIDSSEGLPKVLETLAEYHVRATFFLNGEFIRRFPGAVRQIAEAGHEVGSLFYMYFNLSDSRYQITRDFIKQGLARNEDDYYQATGKELSLLWRTPYYIVSDDIIGAGKEMNYTLVGKDVDSLDSIGKAANTGTTQLYYPSAKLVEMVLEQKKPGSIIALTLGRPGYDENPGQARDDYLFQSLDLLINNLLQRGYTIVPVSTLIETAR